MSGPVVDFKPRVLWAEICFFENNTVTCGKYHKARYTDRDRDRDQKNPQSGKKNMVVIAGFRFFRGVRTTLLSGVRFFKGTWVRRVRKLAYILVGTWVRFFFFSLTWGYVFPLSHQVIY